MGLHMQQSHDLHDLDNITAPVSDGTYYLKVVKSGASITYSYVDENYIRGDLQSNQNIDEDLNIRTTNGNAITLYTYSGTGPGSSTWSDLTLNPVGMTIAWYNQGIGSDFTFNSSGAVFTNDSTTDGLKYAADYSAGFVDRSLVDKAYVDNKVSADAPSISTGTAAPSITPSKIGDIYVDTTNKNVYIAIGTSTAGDFELMN